METVQIGEKNTVGVRRAVRVMEGRTRDGRDEGGDLRKRKGVCGNSSDGGGGIHRGKKKQFE